jgi:hypothetical protein
VERLTSLYVPNVQLTLLATSSEYNYSVGLEGSGIRPSFVLFF